MLYIVRHGRTTWNKEKRIMGHQDIPLCEDGINDVKKLKKELSNIHFDYVFSSPLKRALETAKILTDKKIIIDERLIERYNGDLEGKNKNEINFDFSDLNCKLHNIESVKEIHDRVESFFNEINDKYADKNILIVTHGGVCIQIRYYFEGEPKSGSYEEYLVDNCHVLKYNNDYGRIYGQKKK